MRPRKVLDKLNGKYNCEYWDVRIEETFKTDIVFEDFELISCDEKPSLGAFVRVFNNRMWFYASITNLNKIEETIKELVEQSNAIEINNNDDIKPYNIQPLNETIIKFDQFNAGNVSIKEKVELCKSYFDVLKGHQKMALSKVVYTDFYKNKFFKSSTDIYYNYDFNQFGLRTNFFLKDGDNKHIDGCNMYHHDFKKMFNRQDEVKAAIEEAHKFINAPTVEPGKYPVVMESEVVGVFAHESFGHKSEADFMLGDENAKEAWKIGSKVGNECLSIVDYGADIGHPGYCPIDDEGFPTQKTYLIKNGILQGRLHSTKTANVFDEAPTGNARAKDFEFEPIVRMTSTYVESGEKSLDELISGVDKGVFVVNYNHGSGLSTFTIAPRRAYMIRDGKIAEPVKISVISGSVFEALNCIEGCSNDFALEKSAFGGCGKMEQFPLPVSLGGPQVLISKLMVS